VSDDYSLVSVNLSVRAYTLYSTAKVDDAGIQRLPHLHPCLQDRTTIKDEKYVFFLSSCWSEKLLDSLPLRAIVLPHIRLRGDAKMTPVSPIEAFKALAPSTIFQLSDAKGATLKVVHALVRRLPCYQLELGNKMESVPPLISKLIA
jgi:hypothetical protein